MRAPACTLLACLLAASSLLPAHGAGQGSMTVALEAFSASYGPEGWKDEPAENVTAPLPPLPLGALGVYENPYYSPSTVHAPAAGPVFLGYNLTAILSVRSDTGAPPAATQNVLVGARILVAGGAIPAKLTRISASTFKAEFDLDGENGLGIPVLGAGTHQLHVEVFELPPDLSLQQRVGEATFEVQGAPGAVDAVGFALPEAALAPAVYADLGPSNQTLVLSRLLDPLETVSVNLTFPGSAGRMAEAALFDGARRTVVFRGVVGAAGEVRTEFSPAHATGGNRSAMLVLEGHLVGEAERAGSVVLVLPASPHPTRIVAIQFVPRGVAGQPLSEADTVAFMARDENEDAESSSKSGFLYVLDRAGNVAAQQPFQPAGFLPGSTARTAQVPALQIRSLGLATYRVLATFSDAEGRFYSLAPAVRGISVVAAPAHALPFEPGALSVTIRNFNNNLDSERDDGLALTASIVATGLPGGQAFRGEAVIEEKGERSFEIPFQGAGGEYTVAINVTSGELGLVQTVGVAIESGGPSGILGIPGFEALAAAAALGIALRYRRKNL